MSSGLDTFDSILPDDTGTQGEDFEGMDENMDEKVHQIVNVSQDIEDKIKPENSSTLEEPPPSPTVPV
ncbi:MAG: hypothetical protein WCC17_16875 [Candidatus Nitrosopolaris sp.]